MSKSYAIIELGTGYMDGWYFIPLKEVKDIARYWDRERPKYEHKVIAGIEFFPIDDHPVVFLPDVDDDNEVNP